MERERAVELLVREGGLDEARVDVRVGAEAVALAGLLHDRERVVEAFSAYIVELGRTPVFLKVHQQLYLLELRIMITG